MVTSREVLILKELLKSHLELLCAKLRIQEKLKFPKNPKQNIKAWQNKRTKIRPELTFPLTHTMPL
jgi:hypothetical protein